MLRESKSANTSMARSHIPETLVNLTQAIDDSSELRSWFVGLKGIPFADRINAFSSMAKRMRLDGQDEAVIKAVSSLAHPEIFRAVLSILEGDDR